MAAVILCNISNIRLRSDDDYRAKCDLFIVTSSEV